MVLALKAMQCMQNHFMVKENSNMSLKYEAYTDKLQFLKVLYDSYGTITPTARLLLNAIIATRQHHYGTVGIPLSAPGIPFVNTLMGFSNTVEEGSLADAHGLSHLLNTWKKNIRAFFEHEQNHQMIFHILNHPSSIEIEDTKNILRPSVDFDPNDYNNYEDYDPYAPPRERTVPTSITIHNTRLTPQLSSTPNLKVVRPAQRTPRTPCTPGHSPIEIKECGNPMELGAIPKAGPLDVCVTAYALRTSLPPQLRGSPRVGLVTPAASRSSHRGRGTPSARRSPSFFPSPGFPNSPPLGNGPLSDGWKPLLSPGEAGKRPYVRSPLSPPLAVGPSPLAVGPLAVGPLAVGRVPTKP
jgi:hypothetical protein